MAKGDIAQVTITQEVDVAKAAYRAQYFAENLGFSSGNQNMIATAVSELARNIFKYALKGKITIKKLHRSEMTGIEIVAEDKGAGIKDIRLAMQDHYSTANTLGLGLPGVKRMMDEFSFDSTRKVGTKIKVRKWL